MDAKTLRASILQMAIEGKLVPQRDEEPAVEQVGEAPEDVPFEIPEKWKWLTVGDACTQVSTGPFGSVIHKTDYADDGVPIVNPADMRNGCISTDKIKKVKRDLIGSLSSYVLKENDIVIARRGDLGRCAIVTHSDEGYLCGTGSCFLHLKALLATEYFITFFSSDYIKNKLTASSVGTTMANLNHKILKSLLVPVPPLSEQRRIVARLNELLPLVDKFRKAQEALAVAQKDFPEKLKASLLQEAIQGKLVPQLDEEPAVEQIGEAPEDVPFAIPKKWEWVSLKNITRKIHYGFTASATSSGNCRLLRITDLKPSGMSWETVPYCSTSEEEAQKFSLKKNDIVIARTGGTIGKSFLIRNIEGQSVFASYLIRAIPETKFVNPDFLINFLSSPLYWSQLKEASRGTGQPNVNAKSLGAMWVPLPPIEEQRRIVARLNELLPLVKKLTTPTVK